ncbi:MAG: transaldolase family protein, partial [Elusimicrobiales bacterium]|nr:transaldolase family protein [Elusimicrobiales bacterium]
MNKMIELAALGQSVWYDNISRKLLAGGELKELIDSGLRGLTSNPAIFEKAIAGGEGYGDDIKALAARGLSSREIYEELALADIGRAADLMAPVHAAAGGRDGFVSIEVSPELARDAAGTVKEALRLKERLGRANVMIKVPATPECLPAVRELTAAGVSANVTLIFSVENYRAVAAAYIAGLRDLLGRGGDPRGVSSVASFFVSRIDSAVDADLDRLGAPELKARAAIANAKAAYLA